MRKECSLILDKETQAPDRPDDDKKFLSPAKPPLARYSRIEGRVGFFRKYALWTSYSIVILDVFF